MTFVPTEQQNAIVHASKTTKENLRLIAYAGSAKTSTLELVAHALHSTPILSLAFNKRVAEEMTKRLPGHVLAKTLNSVGHGVWCRTIAKRVNLNTRKSNEYL